MEKTEAQLDIIFAALSDRTRRKILEQVRDKDCTVLELASQFDMSLPAVSKHIKILGRSGLLRRTKDGRFVVCKYDPMPLREAIAWISHQHQFWHEGLEALAAFLDAEAGKENKI